MARVSKPGRAAWVTSFLGMLVGVVPRGQAGRSEDQRQGRINHLRGLGGNGGSTASVFFTTLGTILHTPPAHSETHSTVSSVALAATLAGAMMAVTGTRRTVLGLAATNTGSGVNCGMGAPMARQTSIESMIYLT